MRRLRRRREYITKVIRQKVDIERTRRRYIYKGKTTTTTPSPTPSPTLRTGLGFDAIVGVAWS